MIEVSKDWTPEERLTVINRIAARLYDDSAKATVPRERIFRDAERLMFLSRASKEFLETNREQILSGLK